MTDPTIDDRVLAAFRALVKLQFPQLPYLAAWEYRVHSVDADGRVELLPTSTTQPFQELPPVTMRPSNAGETATPAVGSACIVMFVNGDPSRPMVTFGDPTTPPVLVKLAGGGAGVARQGDSVGLSVTFVPGTGGATLAINGTPCTPSTPTSIPTSITSGSTRVQCGG